MYILVPQEIMTKQRFLQYPHEKVTTCPIDGKVNKWIIELKDQTKKLRELSTPKGLSGR